MLETSPRRWRWAASCALLLAGCAHYTPLPLPTAPPLSASPTVTAPLTIDQVADLALANNPDLKAARLRRGVAAGQAKQAGILPNPTLSGSLLPLISGAGSAPAWNIGLSQDIRALITYAPRRRAAQDSQGQVAADIVWQEWQVAGRARQLAADLILADRARPSYASAYQLLAQRNARLEQALAAGNLTLTGIAPDRVALQAARAALDGVDQKRLALRSQLNTLLGLAPGTNLPLAAEPTARPFDAAAIRAGLPDLPGRRPDLLALRLGYAAADETVRAEILGQFPNLVLGAGVNSDNAHVVNGGPNISLGLPIFDRNQGGVAIANATRAQLHAEYAARLAAVQGEVGAMLAEIEQLSDQLTIARRDLPAAQAAAGQAQTAFDAGRLDERGYVDLVSNRFAKDQEIMTLENALLDRQIAIETLVGDGLPTADLPAEPGTGR
ncbi:TolC family protein [Caulobacter sp. RHG1]|uniref:TolC family protein n=1 Tax=Caulobacter sp. (strain RHG1) TaxID=2545762 RepID=UPI0015579893|nr:TolC family protein [Caulobacter sp. RHG1]NQE61700.1 Heavy metal RND efflux outer membrane protein, CzcC family [Caulobacter sp. RHG1]